MEIPLPPLPVQREIAHILGALDDKIDLNRRMNATLESMARALFKSWFIDFDPVRAKSEGRQPEGMDAETAALFPDSFEDSELGEIPSGWGVSTIGEVLELTYGKPLKAESRFGGEIPVYGANGQIGWHNEKLVDGSGIVVGRKGNPGTVVWSEKDFYPIDTTFYVIPKIELSMRYLFFALQQQNLPDLSSDSGVPGLNRNIAYMNFILMPAPDLFLAFDKLISPLMIKLDENNRESRIIISIRDALLPQLMAGDMPFTNEISY